MTKSQPIIKISGVSFAYSEHSPILSDLDFKFFKDDYNRRVFKIDDTSKKNFLTESRNNRKEKKVAKS